MVAIALNIIAENRPFQVEPGYNRELGIKAKAKAPPSTPPNSTTHSAAVTTTVTFVVSVLCSPMEIFLISATVSILRDGLVGSGTNSSLLGGCCFGPVASARKDDSDKSGS